MKKLIIVTVSIMLASCTAVKHTASPEEVMPAMAVINQPVTEPAEDQDNLILATLWFQKSAEMRALFYQCFRSAELALAENMAMAGRTKPAAVVLDIDETLLDNSPFQGWQVLEKRSFNNDDWFRWVELAQAKPLPGAVEFTRYADSLGVEVFYVSNRTVQELGPTIENMVAGGFVNADTAHMLLKETTSSKVARRDLIEKEYEIILLVGDNLSDLSGAYEKRGADFGFGTVDADRKLFGTKYIVLPNPMYGSWLSGLLKTTPGSTEREKLVNLLEGF
jgi:5'-nucleotidase (lipoprotein e(P4) family)